MNTKLITGLSMLVLGVSACTTTPAPSGDNSVNTLSNVERYQATINAQAKLKNVHVHWVNPPDEDDLKKYTAEAETNGKAELN